MMGIYAIRNKVNGKVYVGQSANIQKRFKQHLDALERGVHHSKKLQKDFDEFGVDKFAFETLELCTSEYLNQKELEWITKFDSIKNGYNVQDPSTRKTLFGTVKYQKSPVITVRGELYKIFRDFAFETIVDFRNWVAYRKKEIQLVLSCMGWVGLGVAVIALGHLVNWLFGDDWTIVYYISLLATFFAVGFALDKRERDNAGRQ